VALSLCTFTVLTLPYLYVLSKITPVTDWFMPVGLPSAVAGIVSVWLLFLLFRYIKINVWYKEAISVFWLGAVVTPVINYFADIYVGDSPFNWDTVLTAFACIVASAVLGILGYNKSKQKPENNQEC